MSEDQIAAVAERLGHLRGSLLVCGYGGRVRAWFRGSEVKEAQTFLDKLVGKAAEAAHVKPPRISADSVGRVFGPIGANCSAESVGFSQTDVVRCPACYERTLLGGLTVAEIVAGKVSVS